MKPACHQCGCIHPGDGARAVGRFQSGGPTGYISQSGGLIRASREEAEADYCASNQLGAGDTTMTTLPYDVSRCCGRFDLRADGEWCPGRDTCQRYLAFSQWDRNAGIPDYQGISVTMGWPDCGMKISVETTE